jgi:hypothetical protein
MMNTIDEPEKQSGEESEARPAFTMVDLLRLRGVGTIVYVELDRDTTDFVHLVGKKVVIDGRMETCFSIERLTHASPWKAGEKIGLLVRKAK